MTLQKDAKEEKHSQALHHSPLQTDHLLPKRSHPCHPKSSSSSLERADPRTTFIRSAVAIAAGPDKLAIDVVAVAVDAHAHAQAAHSSNGLRRAHEDLLEPLGRDAAHHGLWTVRVKGALRLGVVVGGIDDAHGDVVVFFAPKRERS